MQTGLAPLLLRIEQLELSNRRLRRIGSVSLLAALALPGLAFVARAAQDPTRPGPETIRVRAVEVVDASGKVRARLGLDQDNAPELRLLDGQEKVRLRAGIHMDREPILALIDQEDQNRITMVYDGANPHFVMSRPGGKPWIHMTAAAVGDAALMFTHIDGHHNSAIGIRANGDGYLRQIKPSEEAGTKDKEAGNGK